MTTIRFRTMSVLAVLVATHGASAAVSTASSSAFGESVRLDVLPVLGPLIQVSSGPLPSVSGNAPPPFAHSNQVASVNVVVGVLTTAVLQTKLLSVRAASNLPNNIATTADATVNETIAGIAALAILRAKVIHSNVRIDGTCHTGVNAAGSTTLVDAHLNSVLGGAALVANPAPNTVVLNSGGVKIILNEQIVTATGQTARSITVNAVHIVFTNAPSGLGVLTGDIIISQSKASLKCAPPTSDLTITKTGSPNPVAVGADLTYTLKVGNNGPDTAEDVIVTDTLPLGSTFVSANTNQGTCTGTATVKCVLGTLVNGGSATIQIVVKIRQVVNKATVKSDSQDPVGSNSSATFVTTLQ
jgi:uncharacterized repeat protein (TIGR01451 family)